MSAPLKATDPRLCQVRSLLYAAIQRLDGDLVTGEVSVERFKEASDAVTQAGYILDDIPDSDISPHVASCCGLVCESDETLAAHESAAPQLCDHS